MTTPFLLSDLKRDEGFSPKAYPDRLSKGPPWTIGYGHTGREVHPGLKITLAQGEALLRCDVALVLQGLDTALPWWRRLNDARQDVLANMAFEMGVHGVIGFTASLAAIKAGAWPTAAADLAQTLWDHQVPARAQRLIQQMQTGVRTPQPGDPTVSNIDTSATADSKAPLASTTIQGAIIAIVSALAPTFASLLHVDQAQLVEVVGAVGTIVGFAMTVIGRMKATKPIA